MELAGFRSCQGPDGVRFDDRGVPLLGAPVCFGVGLVIFSDLFAADAKDGQVLHLQLARIGHGHTVGIGCWVGEAGSSPGAKGSYANKDDSQKGCSVGVLHDEIPC